MRVANVKTSLRKFFHHWITVTYPLHGLGKTEKSVLAELLYFRYLLSQEVTNEELLDKLLFDYEIKNKIYTALDINKTRLALVFSKLRKLGVLNGKAIAKNYIPKLGVGDKEFILAYKFKIEGNEEGINQKAVSKENEKGSAEEQGS